MDSLMESFTAAEIPTSTDESDESTTKKHFFRKHINKKLVDTKQKFEPENVQTKAEKIENSYPSDNILKLIFYNTHKTFYSFHPCQELNSKSLMYQNGLILPP